MIIEFDEHYMSWELREAVCPVCNQKLVNTYPVRYFCRNKCTTIILNTNTYPYTLQCIRIKIDNWDMRLYPSLVIIYSSGNQTILENINIVQTELSELVAYIQKIQMCL